MEPPVVRSRGRPRKRKREEETPIKVEFVDDVVGDKDVGEGVKDVKNPRKRGRPPMKKVEIRGQAIVGRYVLKEFEGSGVFLGKIVSYDTGLYRVEYEDGDREDLDSLELCQYLIGDEEKVFVGKFLERKNKLDVESGKKSSSKSKCKTKENKHVKLEGELEKGEEGDIGKSLGNGEVPSLIKLSNGEIDGSEVDDNDDNDSSSESCEYGQGWEMRSEMEIPTLPPPELPPSSGTVGVPEDCVSNLFSVFGFLRSFSIRLFLSPFTLNDLVGCLNCTGPNALLDAIHVALLRALRRHLESIASDGNEIGSKCLRCIDWKLLDNLTWPVYLVHYLMVMGHLNNEEWKGFYNDVLEKDYCTLSVWTKIMVLQILCDDALDSEEIRAEIDMREESEVGVNSDRITTNPYEDGPRKVHPRHCKNFAGNVDNVDEDGNGDECRLCGMDGVLLCCDDCPSSYHSRCIGVGKQYISDGEWFCPECTINRVGPSINVTTSLRGAEVFGVDPYAQLFLGTCNHLLVLKVSVKASPFVRYYNRDDVSKILSALCSSPNHGPSYSGICQAILKYWELPLDLLSPFFSNHQSLALENKDNNVLFAQLHPFDKNETQEAVTENCGSSLGESTVQNGAESFTEKLFHKPDPSNVSLMPLVNDTPMNQNFTSVNPSEQAMISCSTQQGSVDGSSVAVIPSYCFGTNGHSSVGHKKDFSLLDNSNVHGKQDGRKFGGRMDQKGKDTCLYMGSSFKPTAYINQYAHGDFAASAAASFAVLSSEESQPSEIHASDPRKLMAANVGLQGKAFSAVAVRFFWPSTDKKLIEVPRERCSWCLHCKSPVSSKKACLLNQAALNSTRVAIKYVLGLRLAKNLEGALYGISAYTLYMEESLHGLILGPFQDASYRQEWQKKVEQASGFSDMKSLLLELEGNLCTVALLSEWTKMVDNWMDEPSLAQSSCPTPSTQKRGPGRRKKHLTVTEATIEESNDSSNDLNWWRGGKLAKLVYRRGTLPCSILKKAARQGGSRRIPGISYADGSEVPKRSRQLIWRASVEMANNVSQLALQVRYLDHHIKWSDLARPEQTVQDGKGPETELYAFRNAHICHKKVAENKIMYGVVFRHQKHLSTRLMKSVIEKEDGQDGKDTYWFSETRVPLYLIKEFEEKSKKSHMLPYLGKPDPLSKLQKRQLKAARKNAFCYLARKKENLYMCLCASCHRDVLLGVAVKCSSCEGYCHKGCTSSSTVLINNDVEFITTCKQCSSAKAVPLNNSTVESPTSPLAMQGQDYQNSASLTNTVRIRSTTQKYQNSATVAKIRPKSNHLPSPILGTSEGLSDNKPPSLDSNKKSTSSDPNLKKSQKKDRQSHWGLIWKKKNTDDGTDFRLKNIIFSGNLHGPDTPRPECYLCHNAYDHNLMYIHCETCQNWYHADALKLEESKLSDLMGFKCCRCRRIKSPVCPYFVEVKRIRFNGPKEVGAVPNCVSASISEKTESVPSTPVSMDEDIYFQVDDSLLSVSEGEEVPEPKVELDFEWNSTAGAGPQKLQVRRHIKNEKDNDCFNWTDQSLAQLPPSIETKNDCNNAIEWNVSNDIDLEVGTSFDYDVESLNFENADFEPQTYFSFTELLDADEGDQLGGVDASVDAWQNLPCEISRPGFAEEGEMGFSNNEGPTTCANCSMCSEITPTDLCCRICGLNIHSHCSPWEPASQGETWCCGNCIAWR